MRNKTTKLKELIILTEHFSPSTGATAQLVSDLADELNAKGVPIRILTSTPGPPGLEYPIVRFTNQSQSPTGILKKALAGTSFFFFAILWLIRNVRFGRHSLFIVSNPPFIGLIGPILKVSRNLEYCFLLQDIFPRSASLTGILPAKGPLVLFWKLLMRIILSRSKFTIVLSSGMLARSHKEFGEKPNIYSIPNWSIISPRYQLLKSNSDSYTTYERRALTIQYSGNFGRLHDILTLLESARCLSNHHINFTFIGDGPKKYLIDKYIHAYSLSNVTYLPYQTREKLPFTLSACDLSVVSLIAGSEDTVAPSKLYGILSLAKPVLLIASDTCELANLIKQNDCGYVVAPGDVETLCSRVLSLKSNPSRLASMSRNSGILYSAKYGKEKSINTYYQLLSTYELI